MLRLLVLLLLLANGGYFAWSQGLLRAYGFAPAPTSEPQRMAQQIRPEALQVLTPDEVRKIEAAAAAAPAGASRPSECLQAGLFDDAQATALKQALEAELPAAAWMMDPAIEPARWIVYMGKFPTAEALARKRGELAGLNVKSEAVTSAGLAFGLSLGGFDTQAAANAELALMGKRGVRTARVVQEHPEVRGTLLRFPAVDDALRARLEAFKPVLAGRILRSCR